MAYNDKKKTSRFNPFSWMNKDGIGVEDAEPPILDNPGIKNYFKLIGRKLNQIVTSNLLLVFGNFPVLFILAVLSGYFSIQTTAPTYSIFAQINGAAMHSQNAYVSAILGLFSSQSNVTVLSQVDKVFLLISLLVFLTFGCVTAGVTYIMRNIVREEPIFIWHDFWYCVKRNWKQAVVFGIIDLIIILLIAYDVVFLNLNYSSSMVTVVMFFASLVLAALYTIMRMYIYPMMITFDLSIKKLFKNALIFTILGIKRNAVALLLTVAIAGINLALLTVYFPLGLLLPFVIVFSLITFTGTYYAYPVISKYMIEPYYTKDGELKGALDDVQAADLPESDDSAGVEDNAVED